jgi:hypothetical protein
LLEFLNKGKSFSNLSGEKLSEYQVIHAVEQSFHELRLPIEGFTLAPIMERQPRYVLLVERKMRDGRTTELAGRLQENLARMNEEYAAKCASRRLLPVEIREVPRGTWSALRDKKTRGKGNFEQYKQPCLVQDLGFVDSVAPRPKVSREKLLWDDVGRVRGSRESLNPSSAGRFPAATDRRGYARSRLANSTPNDVPRVRLGSEDSTVVRRFARPNSATHPPTGRISPPDDLEAPRTPQGVIE